MSVDSRFCAFEMSIFVPVLNVSILFEMENRSPDSFISNKLFWPLWALQLHVSLRGSLSLVGGKDAALALWDAGQ